MEKGEVFLCHGKREHQSSSNFIFNDFLFDEWLRSIIEERLPEDQRALGVNRLEGKGLDANSVISSVSAPSFFASHIVTVVKGVDQMSENEQNKLGVAIQNGMPDGSTLILAGNSVDKRKKLYLSANKAGKAMEFGPVAGTDLRNWLRDRLKKMGMQISREAGEFLLERDSSNLGILANDLEKISIRWLGRKSMLGVEDIRDLIGGTPEKSVFDLVDKIGERSVKDALFALHSCFELSKEDPRTESSRLLSMIARQVRTMLYCKALSDKDMNAQDIAAMAEVHPYTVQKCRTQAANFNIDELTGLYVKLAETDIGMKTSNINGRQALETLVMSVAGGRQP